MDETGTQNTLWDLDAFFLDTGYSGCFFFPLNVQTKTSGAFTVPNLVLFFIQEITRGHLSESSCARKRKNTCQSGTLDPKPPLVSGFF